MSYSILILYTVKYNYSTLKNIILLLYNILLKNRYQIV